MMNLDEFIREAKGHRMTRGYLTEPGFLVLYVRHTLRWVNGHYYHPILDLASIEVEEKGKGTFTRLIERIRRDYPRLPIYVENVLTFRFDRKLESLGFVNVGPGVCPCFLLDPAKLGGREHVQRTD